MVGSNTPSAMRNLAAMARHRRRGHGRAAFLTVVVATFAVAGILGWRLSRPASGTTTTAPPSTTPPSTTQRTTTSLPPVQSTTTTVPVGSLPQTPALPPAVTHGLTQRIRDLLEAIATDDVTYGIPAFFPVQAYVQTKSYSDAAHDWKTRLIPEYAVDIGALHRTIDPSGSPLRLLGYAVDDPSSIWVLPGEEFNKGPYWRVYYATVSYGAGGQRGSFTINTMISWRGEWYVSHIASFNS